MMRDRAAVGPQRTNLRSVGGRRTAGPGPWQARGPFHEVGYCKTSLLDWARMACRVKLPAGPGGCDGRRGDRGGWPGPASGRVGRSGALRQGHVNPFEGA
jgi:hypothetical protein